MTEQELARALRIVYHAAMDSHAAWLAVARRAIELTAPKVFPIQPSSRKYGPHPTAIPWHVADLAYSVYSQRNGRDQSLEQLSKRGGFGPEEMDGLLPHWKELVAHELTAPDEAGYERAAREVANQREAHDSPDLVCPGCRATARIIVDAAGRTNA